MDIFESMKEGDIITIEYKGSIYKIIKLTREKSQQEIMLERQNKGEQILFYNI